jgi:Flp pilus assembly protein CpaB
MRLLDRTRTTSEPTNGRPAQAQASLRDRLGARVGYRARTLGLGIVLALLAGLLTLAYVNRAERRAALSAANVRVFVAARDIPAGTSGTAVVGRRLLVEQRVPRRTVVSGAIDDPSQIEELASTDRIYQGEQLTTRRFRPVAERGLRGELSGTSRAIVVAGDRTQILTGILRAGDRVDVLAAIPFENRAGKQIAATRVILRDLLVVRPPRVSSERGRDASSTLVLALTDAQSQKLFFAMKHGHWSLILRPFGRAADGRTRVDTAESVLGAGR